MRQQRGCGAGVNHPAGNRRQVGLEPPLGFKPRTERRLVKPRAQAWHHAAADEHAAARPERERKVARHAAQEAAEQLQRLQRERVVGLQGQLGHLRGGADFLAAALGQPAQRVVQVHQPSATHGAFGRHVAVALLQDGQHIEFTLGLRGQRDMAALTRQRHAQAGPRRKYQARHAQARARAQQRNRGARHGLATAHGAQLLGREHGQRQRECSEVVDDHQPLKTKRLAHGALRKAPAVVGHADRVARDRVGDAKRRLAGRGDVHLGQVGRQGSIHRGELSTGQHTGVVQGAVGLVLPGQANVGAADVGQQAQGCHAVFLSGGLNNEVHVAKR